MWQWGAGPDVRLRRQKSVADSGGGAGGLGPPFFSESALAHCEGVAPRYIMCACACTSERFLYRRKLHTSHDEARHQDFNFCY